MVKSALLVVPDDTGSSGHSGAFPSIIEGSLKISNKDFFEVSGFLKSALGSIRTLLLNQLLTLESACRVLTVGDGWSKSLNPLGDGVFTNGRADLPTYNRMMIY